MPTTVITVCDTCKRQDWAERGDETTDGARLASLVETIADKSALVEVRRQSCLMGCEHGCNVAVQAAGKLTYVLGRFEPGTEAADAIVTYAERHAAAETGQVPFKEWPQGVKGHFVARIPALPAVGKNG